MPWPASKVGWIWTVNIDSSDPVPLHIDIVVEKVAEVEKECGIKLVRKEVSG